MNKYINKLIYLSIYKELNQKVYFIYNLDNKEFIE